MVVDRKRDVKQVINSLLDDDGNLKVGIQADLTLASQEVEVSALDGDTIAIADGLTGNSLEIVGRKLQAQLPANQSVELKRGVNFLSINADGSLNISGATQAAPSTDFRTATLTVTDTAQAITFAGFVIRAISITALGTNTGSIKLGKSDVVTNFALLAPGTAVSLPVAASTEPVYYVRDAGAGTFQISILAVN